MNHAIREEPGRLELNAKAATQAANADTPQAIVDLDEQRSALELQVKNEERRLDRLEDLLLDGTIKLVGKLTCSTHIGISPDLDCYDTHSAI